MRRISDIRSGLATRALHWAINRGASEVWLSLVATLMPKTFGGADIRISRHALEAIVREVATEDVSVCLTRINARAGESVWVAAFAVEYGLLRGDWAFVERYLQPCLAKQLAMGVQPPKRYLTLLVASQIEDRRPSDALQTLARYAPRHGRDTSDHDAGLLAASALVDEETHWLARVNAVFAAHRMGPLDLDGAKSETKFSRLTAKSTLTGTGRGSAAAKVTVIVSCFNAEEHVETSLQSLFEQGAGRPCFQHCAGITPHIDCGF